MAIGSPEIGDPSQDAFARWAGAGRSERARQEALLVDLILGDNGAGRSAAGSLLTSEMLKVLASNSDGG